MSLIEAGRLIVCERTGAWAAALARVLPDWQPAIRETRSFAECLRQLAAAPHSIVCVELTRGNVAAALDFVADLPRQFPGAEAAVLASREAMDYEWLFREAGAVHFVWSPRRLTPLADLAGRFLRRLPKQPTSAEETIWAMLPWNG